MNRTEAAALLAVIAAYDRRQYAEPDVLAFHEALHDLPADLCRAAVAEHYRRETSWLMPAHVRRLVTATRNQRALSYEPAGRELLVPKPPWFDEAAAAFKRGDHVEGERVIRAGRYGAQAGAA